MNSFSSQVIRASAPSNIAWIKYMGKKSEPGNIPLNPSLSLTLDQLCTQVDLRVRPLTSSQTSSWKWVPDCSWEVGGKKGISPCLSEEKIRRLQLHAARVHAFCVQSSSVLKEWGLTLRSNPAEVEIRSVNTFPAESGIASSASSFAALTLALVAAECSDPTVVAKLFHAGSMASLEFRKQLSTLCRAGSGSSCRSLSGPWVVWEKETGVELSEIHPRFFKEALTHFVLLTQSGQKAVSSSEAHRRVLTSSLWTGRGERASLRFQAFQEGLKKGDWECLAGLAWEDFFDMHTLFHTALPPFTYWNSQTWGLLQEVFLWGTSASLFPKGLARPWVTLDAGPHVHWLVPKEESDRWRTFFQEQWKISFLEDQPGLGAQLWVKTF